MRARVDAPDGARARLAATVAALRDPVSYPDPVTRIETIETHMSWVFLTERHAYKLKKPIRTPVLDYTTLLARRRACWNELVLNRRLAPEVYLGVVPLVRRGDDVALEQDGEAIDWLVKMQRLPRDTMLDMRIEAGKVADTDIDELAAVLIRFFRTTRRAKLTGPGYHARFAADIADKTTALQQPHYGLDVDDVQAVLYGLARWLARHGDRLGARARSLVDGHGDLRPEHVCLREPTPIVIDCLEFDRELRRLDPVSELSFLALECRRLGAAWIGERLLSHYADMTDDEAPEPLICFYQSHHALVRATIAVWHLDDDAMVDDPERWRERGRWYLQTARELLRESRG